MSGDKPVPPGKRQWQLARKRGHFPQLHPFIQALVYGSAPVLIFIAITFEECWVNLQLLIKYGLQYQNFRPVKWPVFLILIQSIFIPLFIAALTGVAIGLVVCGGVLQLPFKGRPVLITPGALLRRAKEQLVPLCVQLLLFLITLIVLVLCCQQATFQQSAEGGSNLMMQTGFIICFLQGTVLFLIVAFGALCRHRKFRRSLYMTHQESREDQKASEGNPEMKQRRHQVARALLDADLVEAVRKAGVVIIERQEVK